MVKLEPGDIITFNSNTNSYICIKDDYVNKEYYLDRVPSDACIYTRILSYAYFVKYYNENSLIHIPGRYFKCKGYLNG